MAGELHFCIGMSEPGSGSDLFAAKTKATKTDGGYLINGTKIWTSNAHKADYMIGLFRTSPSTKENRRHGLTSFLVDMKKTPGITCNPIGQMSGLREFNEVVFQDAFVPDDHVLGEIDGAWKQATTELAYERSGPERFLETYYVLTELVRAPGPNPDTRSAEGVGRLVAQLHTLRRMSVSVAGMLEAGKEPVVESSIVKDLGTVWNRSCPPRFGISRPSSSRCRATSRRSPSAWPSPRKWRRNSRSRAARRKCCAASSREDSACGDLGGRCENHRNRTSFPRVEVCAKGFDFHIRESNSAGPKPLAPGVP